MISLTPLLFGFIAYIDSLQQIVPAWTRCAGSGEKETGDTEVGGETAAIEKLLIWHGMPGAPAQLVAHLFHDFDDFD